MRKLFAPVVLNKYFVKAKAVQQGNKVRVTWATDAVSKAADVFIERSTDGNVLTSFAIKRWLNLLRLLMGLYTTSRYLLLICCITG